MKQTFVRIGRWASLAMASLVMAGAIVVSPPAGATAASRAFVYAVWTDFLGTAPDSSTLAHWEGQLDGALVTRAQVISSVLGSAALQDNYQYSVFQLYLDRYPTDAEYSAAATAMSGGDFTEVELIALASDWYYEEGGSTDSAFVTDLFSDLLLRAPGSSELTYWVGQLASSTRKQVAKSIMKSSESSTIRVEGDTPSPCASTQLTGFADVVAGAYCLLLKRPADTAGSTYWVSYLAGNTNQMTAMWKQFAGSTEYYTNALARFPSV